MTNSENNARLGRYELQIEIKRDRATVWRALTKDTNAWWLPSFHMVSENSTVSFEPKAGGQLLERQEGGGSLLWYTVQMVDPGTSIHLVGYSFPQWGGPGITMLELALEDSPSGCVLRISDAHIGRATDEHLASLREGWTTLFTDGLKAHCEAA